MNKENSYLDLEAEIIHDACVENGLDGHIRWIAEDDDTPLAVKFAAAWVEVEEIPVKTSYMFCDLLDMCFFFAHTGKRCEACVGYSGYASAGSKDMNGNLVIAFQLAKKVVDRMQELCNERMGAENEMQEKVRN